MRARRRARSTPLPKIRVPKGSAINVTRPEFDAVIKLLNQHGEIINALRRELDAAAAQAEKNRQTLDVQFTRIAQLQQEIDALKRPRKRLS